MERLLKAAMPPTTATVAVPLSAPAPGERKSAALTLRVVLGGSWIIAYKSWTVRAGLIEVLHGDGRADRLPGEGVRGLAVDGEVVGRAGHDVEVAGGRAD